MDEKTEDEDKPQEVPEDEPDIIPLEQEPIDLAQPAANIDIASIKHDIGKCKLKRDIIDGIKRLAPGRYSDSELKKMKRADLKALLTEVFEAKCRETLVGADDDEKLPDPGMEQKRRDGKMVTEAMYQVLLGMCSVTEGLTKRFNGYLGGMCLHEWRKTIDSSDFTRETLKQVLFEVYLEHQEVLTKMMSKEGRLVCCLVLSGVQCVRKYNPALENGPKNPMEQNNMYRRGPEPRQNQPRPIPHPRAFSPPVRPDHIIRERGLSDPMGFFARTKAATPSLP